MTWSGRGGLAGAAALVASFVGTAAMAGPIAIGVQVGNGPIVTPASEITNGTTTLLLSSAGGFSLDATGTGDVLGVAPELLSDAIATDIKSAGTISLYVSETGVEVPAMVPGKAAFTSGFTSNLLTRGWTVTEATYADFSDRLYGTGTRLRTTGFTGLGALGSEDSVAVPKTPYALTEVYTIAANGPGSANLTVDLAAISEAPAQAVPEPTALAVLATGLLGIAVVRRRSI